MRSKITLLACLIMVVNTTIHAQNELLHLSFDASDFSDETGTHPEGTGYDITFVDGFCNTNGIELTGDITNGVVSHVEVEDSSTLRPGTFTLAVWAMYTDSSTSITYPYVACKRAEEFVQPFDSYGIYIDNSGSMGSGNYWSVAVGRQDGHQTLNSLVEVELGVWTHIALTYQSSMASTLMSVYIDGQLVNSVNLPFSPLAYTFLPFRLGTARNAGGNTQFEGKIDELYLIDQALTDTEIQDLMDCSSLSVEGLNNEIGSQITVYPNPTNDRFEVEAADVEKVIVTDLKGKQLLEFPGSEEYDISSLSAGIYMVAVQTQKGVFTEQIIKK
jgi:hypothetical protein